MPALVVPSGAQLRMRWLAGQQDLFTVLGLWLGPGAVVDQSAANEFSTITASAWTTSTVAQDFDVSTLLLNVGVRDLRQANLPEYIGTSLNNAGSAVGERTSIATALCVTLRTSRAGKSYRGRVYLPMDGGGAFDAETHSYAGASSDRGNNFITMLRQGIANSALLGGNFQLAVVSRKLFTATPVTANSVRSVIGTSQRRRIPKRG
jgi:hypothetical protein